MHGIKRGYIQPYIDEFLWKQNNQIEEPFYLLLDSIKKTFPLNSKILSQ